MGAGGVPDLPDKSPVSGGPGQELQLPDGIDAKGAPELQLRRAPDD